MATSMSTKEEDQYLNQVWSWIHDERRCVTVQTISLAMGLPRSQASALLAKLFTYKSRNNTQSTADADSHDYSYECVKTVKSQQNGKTVFKLCKSIVSPNDMDVDHKNDEQDKDEITTNQSSCGTAGTVYSLALLVEPTTTSSTKEPSPSVHIAHERDMAHFRDLLQDEELSSHATTACALDSDVHQARIASNAHFTPGRLTAVASQQARLANKGGVAEGAASAAHAAVAAAPFSSAARASRTAASSSAPRRATTAANFFASKQRTTAAKPSAKTAAASSSTRSTAKRTQKTSSGTTNGESAANTAANKDDDPQDSMEVDDHEDVDLRVAANGENKTTSTTMTQEEKENSCNASSSSKTARNNRVVVAVGNADDFVGDQDEDDEFLQQEEERKSRNRAAASARAKTTNVSTASAAKQQSRHGPRRGAGASKPTKSQVAADDDDDTMLVDIDNEQASVKVHGAMDAFVADAKPMERGSSNNDGDKGISAQHPHKKRRKRLVEKSFQDANGYLVSETQVVWEDVESDEDDTEKHTSQSSVAKTTAAAAKKPPAKPTKNMKQGNLMGFFAKKK